MVEAGCETEGSQTLYVHGMTVTRGVANRVEARSLRQTLGNGDGVTDGTSHLTSVRLQPLHSIVNLRVCLTNGRRCPELCVHMSNATLMGFHKHAQREEQQCKLNSEGNTATVGTTSQHFLHYSAPKSLRIESRSINQSKIWRVPRLSQS
jgi:hypothetical protein